MLICDPFATWNDYISRFPVWRYHLRTSIAYLFIYLFVYLFSLYIYIYLCTSRTNHHANKHARCRLMVCFCFPVMHPRQMPIIFQAYNHHTPSFGSALGWYFNTLHTLHGGHSINPTSYRHVCRVSSHHEDLAKFPGRKGSLCRRPAGCSQLGLCARRGTVAPDDRKTPSSCR